MSRATSANCFNSRAARIGSALLFVLAATCVYAADADFVGFVPLGKNLAIYSAPAGPPGPGDDLQKFLPLARNLPVYAPKPSRDPLGPIADKMGEIVSDLRGLRTDAPVQAKEQQVAGDLDTIIKKLEAACKDGNGGGSPNPTKPMSRSVLAKGPGGSGPLHDAQSGTRVWGQLPPKEREQVMQSQTEGFPAGFESVLANYYSRLAQEQVGGDAAGAASPATRPAP